MWFMIHNINAPDALARRPQLEQAHWDYLRALQHRMITAGPYFSSDGETRIGSIFIVDFPNAAVAKEWIDEEPFTKAGLYQRYTIHVYDHRWPKENET